MADQLLLSLYKPLIGFASISETQALSLYYLIRDSPPYNFLLFYFLIFLFFWRLLSKLTPQSCPAPSFQSQSPEEILKFLDQGAKEIKDSIQGIKPKVPQINYNAMAVPKKIDGLLDKVKEVQDMHSAFQTEVIEAHLSIFKILNNDGDKDYLKLPEREAVEPDSALPPLENEEIIE